MPKKCRRTFLEILRDEAPRNASRLEIKARQASWLAKIHQPQSAKLYEIKHDALRQLFRIPKHSPVIRDAWISARGYLLSVWLNRTGSKLHVPFEELRITTQQAHGAWVARRARGRRYRGDQTNSNRSAEATGLVGVKSR